MPRPHKLTTKGEERKTFAEQMENQIIALENTIDVAVSKNVLYATEKTLLSNAIKRLREPIRRIR